VNIITLKRLKKEAILPMSKGSCWKGGGTVRVNNKEQSPTKLAAIFAQSRRTRIREIKRGKTTQRRSSDWVDVE
jgi:hypothetical protein